ncbi:MAG: argininosuccinate lyase [Clostridiales bacterium]|nr:argininosuccinate lyase [Clostridiales bacterium]
MTMLWAGRFAKELDSIVADFNSSIKFDSRMIEQDIIGSLAHASMLGETGIISMLDQSKITSGLSDILLDIKSGKLAIDYTQEDIHTFVENELIKRIGDAGKKLHTARSRNDQVALDLRLTLKQDIKAIYQKVKYLLSELVELAKEYTTTIMPGYTHLQRAQPTTFAHHLMAYSSMFIRDIERLKDCYKRTDVLPLGSCAFAGTTYPIDRSLVAQKLNFEQIAFNSMDAVSDRDFVIELNSCLSIIMMHLSRFCEEIILWSSWEFKFIELDDGYATGSSIMPQKKNADIAELVRGKTGRVYGNLMAILTVMKGLPLAYNKDMQEDKECVFDSVKTVSACLTVFAPMLCSIKVNKEAMAKAAERGFINATDVADYLTKKGMPFRDAYKITGQIVAYCIEKNYTLNNLPIESYKSFSQLFASDLYEAIDMKTCVEKRNSFGATSKSSVLEQIKIVKDFLDKMV